MADTAEHTPMTFGDLDHLSDLATALLPDDGDPDELVHLGFGSATQVVAALEGVHRLIGEVRACWERQTEHTRLIGEWSDKFGELRRDTANLAAEVHADAGKFDHYTEATRLLREAVSYSDTDGAPATDLVLVGVAQVHAQLAVIDAQRDLLALGQTLVATP